MSQSFFDQLETRDPIARERAQMALLPDLLRRAKAGAPGWAAHLANVEPAEVASREALARLPLLRKASLTELQARRPPFGGFAIDERSAAARIFMSPGPIWEPEGRGQDWWRSARALHAAGFGPTDIVLNTFSYHLTPGGWLIDAGLRTIGCAVIPAGPGNTEQQVEAIAHLKPTAYVGVPEFLKILLDKSREMGRSAASIRKALVSGGALLPALRQEYRYRGISVMQTYGTADVGMIAYESRALEGLIVDEGVIVEIVRPGTGDLVPDGEVGEVVVTSFNRDYPMIRLATGDLSAVLPGASPCGRTNMRIKGWLGRADQSAKVKGTLVLAEQIAEVAKRHPGLGRLRLVVGRSGEIDTMTLRVEAAQPEPGLAERIVDTLGEITRLKGEVELVAQGTLPNDGRVIVDERGHV
jgi:phenylacetate-CoA ligase